MYNEKKTLKQLYLTDGAHGHTHEMDPWVFSRRAGYLPASCGSTDSNPRPKVHGPRTGPSHTRHCLRPLQPRPRPSAERNRHDPCLPNSLPDNHSTLLLRREGLVLPATRLLIGRWVVRRLVAASRLAGARVWCSPSAHWLGCRGKVALCA